MIAAAVVCPHPPLIFRELTGQRDVAAELREACLAALRSATGSGTDRVVVIGGADATSAWDAALEPEVRSYGTTGARHDVPALPLSLGVARRLLEEAGWRGPVELQSIGWDASSDEVDAVADKLGSREERITLLVLGEGSTRRGDKAPGYLDERAFPFDDSLGAALETGDTAALHALDPGLAAELMVSGRAALAVLASAVHREGRTPRARMLYRNDPFGVMYFVAAWDLTNG